MVRRATLAPDCAERISRRAVRTLAGLGRSVWGTARRASDAEAGHA
jgi:hypothetical protein